jgi:hypothetical protein
MSREKELNSRLAECRQIFERLRGVGADLGDIDLSTIHEARRRFFVTAFYDLLLAIDAVDQLLKDISLDGVIQNVAPESIQYYRNNLAPNRKKLGQLLMGLLDLPNVDLDRNEFRPAAEGSPVWNILSSGFRLLGNGRYRRVF